MNRAPQPVGAKALIVDDDAFIALVMQAALVEVGIPALIARDGAEGLRMARELLPDVILLDVNMPGMDGFEVCENLREQPETRNIPVVITTGLSDLPSIQRGFELGASDFITKPISPPILQNRVRFLLRAHQHLEALRGALDELGRSRQRLEHVHRLAEVASWEWDAATDEVTLAPEMAALVGVEGRLSLDGWLRFVHPDDREALRKLLREVAEGRSASRLDLRMLNRGGAERVVHQVMERLPDDGRGRLRTLATVQDVTARVKAEERIRELAFYDALTGLPNRRMLDDHLARAVRWAAGSSRRLAVLFVDLDRFKRINDTLGHVAGDALLVEAAERIVRVVRNSDWVSRGRQAEATVSRFGGDEFIVVLSDLGDPDGAAIVARRLLEAFEAPLVVEGQPLVVTASIGIACHPEDGSEPEALVRRADAAMYQSKQSGRNTFQFFDAEANLRSERALVLERELRMAFERGELRLCYQPVVDTRTGSVRRFEALARWRHPTLGSVRPEEFVRIAEETGMIGLLGRWALEAACIQMREWHAAGFPALSVSVNVSAQQIRRGDLVGDVERVLAVSGLPASALDLEITESTFLENAEIVRDAFAQLRARGVRLTIDDFGTGYSPLAYLRDFPIGSLKIDRRFVEAMGRSERGAALVAAIIALGHRLGMTVVAEGVGDEAQRASLTEEGCDLLQGFGISPPLEADEVAAFLSAKEAAEAR